MMGAASVLVIWMALSGGRAGIVWIFCAWRALSMLWIAGRRDATGVGRRRMGGTKMAKILEEEING